VLPEDTKASLAALSLRVRDPEATAAYFDEQSIAYRRSASGAIGFAPQDAHRVMLEFVPAGTARSGAF